MVVGDEPLAVAAHKDVAEAGRDLAAILECEGVQACEHPGMIIFWSFMLPGLKTQVVPPPAC
jgi:hypothetical protein